MLGLNNAMETVVNFTDVTEKLCQLQQQPLDSQLYCYVSDLIDEELAAITVCIPEPTVQVRLKMRELLANIVMDGASCSTVVPIVGERLQHKRLSEECKCKEDLGTVHNKSKEESSVSVVMGEATSQATALHKQSYPTNMSSSHVEHALHKRKLHPQCYHESSGSTLRGVAKRLLLLPAAILFTPRALFLWSQHGPDNFTSQISWTPYNNFKSEITRWPYNNFTSEFSWRPDNFTSQLHNFHDMKIKPSSFPSLIVVDELNEYFACIPSSISLRNEFPTNAYWSCRKHQVLYKDCSLSEEPVISGSQKLSSLTHKEECPISVVRDESVLIKPRQPNVSVVTYHEDKDGLNPVLTEGTFVPSKIKGNVKGPDIYYMYTSIAVVIAYGLLLLINFQYCLLAPLPISLVGCIIHLRNDICRSKDTEDPKVSKVNIEKDTNKVKELERTMIIPYLMLLINVIYGDCIPVLSHFLLFSCCVLGALAHMHSKLVAEVIPALTQALEWIQRAYIVMMFITAHTILAERLGDVTALVCMPELIAGLLWFSTLLYSDCSNSTADKVFTSDKDDFILVGSNATDVPCFLEGLIFNNGSMFFPLGAILAGLTSTYAYERDELQEAVITCSIAGCMPYLSVLMISLWPGSIPGSEKATRLLKFPANICLTGACLMLFYLFASKILTSDLIGPNALKYLPGIYFTIAVALFVKYLADALLHIEYVTELPPGFAAE